MLTLPGAARAVSNQDCFDCHTPDLNAMAPDDRAEMVLPADDDFDAGHKQRVRWKDRTLEVDKESFAKSVHKDLDCTNCHADIDEVPHKAVLAAVDCGSCHTEIGALYHKSVHGKLVGKGNGKAAGCADCHGAHDILKAKDPNSRIAKKNVADTCGKCHLDDPAIAEKSSFATGLTPAILYQSSIHAQAIQRGNNSAATCNDCHESHSLLPMSDPASSIFKMNVSKTCGKCHYREASEYDESVHGVALGHGIFDSPSCNDCHGEHGVVATTDPRSSVYRATVSKVTCFSCHSQERIIRKYGLASKRFQTYEDSFHGLADMLGDTTVANCSSCHGIHNIFPSSDERSTVNQANLGKTCGSCHPKMSEGFAGRIHGEPSNSIGYRISRRNQVDLLFPHRRHARLYAVPQASSTGSRSSGSFSASARARAPICASTSTNA
ncbi:MAG: cytochrome c3 family protein [Deltaproteobacteria bacterium]|nr:cytochrome c3 family protein [Deltaproteobacteria bacterium]